MADGVCNVSAGALRNHHLSSAADIDADKMQHTYEVGTDFQILATVVPTAKTVFLFQAQQTGTLRRFNAGLVDTGTSTSVTYDLKKNGTTCLSSVITVTHAAADNSQNEGTLSVTTFVAGDVFTAVLAVSASTGALGPFATVAYEENAAP